MNIETYYQLFDTMVHHLKEHLRSKSEEDEVDEEDDNIKLREVIRNLMKSANKHSTDCYKSNLNSVSRIFSVLKKLWRWLVRLEY